MAHWVRAAACFMFDRDAESPLLFEHPETADQLDVMSHQACGPRTCLLRLLDRGAIRATFFTPGYTAVRWPDAVRAIRDAGHEIAHHGCLHEGWRTQASASRGRTHSTGAQPRERVPDRPGMKGGVAPGDDRHQRSVCSRHRSRRSLVPAGHRPVATLVT